MFEYSSFNSSVKDIAVNITDKHYSNYGIMWNELSKMTGIDRPILERYDDWYILEDGLYYFKDRCRIEELFISELAYECNVRCVEFLVALNNSNLGIISKLYREKSKNYYMYNDFCKKYFNKIPNDLGIFKLASSITLGEDKMKRLMNDVFSMISFDIFCGQWDREEYNFFFECDSKNVRIAPLCDNGVAFQRCSIYSSPFGEFNLDEDMISKGNLPFIISNEKIFYNKLALLLDINVEEILDRTCEKYRIDFHVEDKKKLLGYFDNKKGSIQHILKLSKYN